MVFKATSGLHSFFQRSDLHHDVVWARRALRRSSITILDLYEANEEDQQQRG